MRYFLYLSLVAASVACSHAGSTPAPETAKPCAELDIDACAAKYETELTACTIQADTREESERCEDGVRDAYGRPPRSSATKDGGAR